MAFSICFGKAWFGVRSALSSLFLANALERIVIGFLIDEFSGLGVSLDPSIIYRIACLGAVYDGSVSVSIAFQRIMIAPCFLAAQPP